MHNYIKLALRIQKRYKWFTLINVAGLLLGVLCSIVILLYVHFHFSTDSYHKDAHNIYRLVLDIHTPDGAIEYEEGSALPMAHALREEFAQIEATAFCMQFYSSPTITIQNAGKTDKYKETNIAYANYDFLYLLKHDFITGNKNTALHNPRSVVLTEKQAIKYFGKTDVIGTFININNTIDLVITGVLAA